MELGDPISYMTLEAGVPVFSRDGDRVGAVEHVLADSSVDVFDGIVIDGRTGPGGWRFVDAPEVETIHERGVVLALSTDEVKRLPEPSANAASMAATPDDVTPDHLRDKLRRAWDLISGRY